MMGHSTQQSRDTTSGFVGVFGHDGTNDVHMDVFGGANWENDVWCASVADGVGPDSAAMNVRHFVHTFPPHGEAQGQELSWLSPAVFAPGGVAGNVPLFDAKFKSAEHGNHRDDLLALVVANANNGRITGYVGIVVAAHWIPDRHFFFVCAKPRDEVSASNATGAVAIAIDFDAGVLHGALGLLGARKSDLKELYLKLGPKKVGLSEPQSHFDELDDDRIAGIFEIRLGTDIFEHLNQSEFTIAADLQDGTRWESSLVPASTFDVSQQLASGCRPASVTATKWGPWKANEAEADSEAYAKARGAAGRACDGRCNQNNLNCKYTELEAELVETELRTTEGGLTEYRVKVRSKGKCECQ